MNGGAEYVKAQRAIDINAIEKLDALQVVGEDDIIVSLIDSLEKTSKERVLKISKSLHEHNLNEMASAAHALKSSSLILGAKHLSSICKKLEELGRNRVAEVGVEDEAKILLIELQVEIARVIDELSAIRRMRS